MEERKYYIYSMPPNIPIYIQELIEKEDEESLYKLLYSIIAEYIHEVRIHTYRLKLKTKEAQKIYPLINQTEEEKTNYFIKELCNKYIEYRRLPPNSGKYTEEEFRKQCLDKIVNLIYNQQHVNETEIKSILYFLNLIVKSNFNENYFSSIEYKYSHTLLKYLIYLCNTEHIKDKPQPKKIIDQIIHQFIINYEIAIGDTSVYQQINTLFENKLLQLFRSDFFPAKKLYIKRLLDILTQINQEEGFQDLWTKDLLTLLQDLIQSDKDFQQEARQNPLPPSQQKEPTDYSDTNNVEKIIFLHKLGVLEYLRNQEPFNHSTNLLAEYLSAVTGIKATTVQSYINPIINKNAQQNKSALHNPNTVNKVEQKLIKIGCKAKDLLT
ncbi:hypothetical protein ETU08_00390 [Apibacter muscae]|uniref:hypothetical protein n=1 Tax=Apibacter muscae TaxID=2509004 RepID=UPI0011AC6AE6|nr:hypothetical protein [Apibacter muscae]TWP31798.1 hypothetical protein ETU08_00390 [Apibacter muscae]